MGQQDFNKQTAERLIYFSLAAYGNNLVNYNNPLEGQGWLDGDNDEEKIINFCNGANAELVKFFDVTDTVVMDRGLGRKIDPFLMAAKVITIKSIPLTLFLAETIPVDTQAFIAKDLSNNSIILAFRGTELPPDKLKRFIATRSLRDWRGNLFHTDQIIEKDNYEMGHIEGGLHRGFLADYLVVRKGILEVIEPLLGDYNKLYVTGHSMGGALATLAALDIHLTFASRVEITVYTFASPKVGDEDFVAQYNGQLFDSHRVAMTVVSGLDSRVIERDDLVTNVPFFGYEHVGKSLPFTIVERGNIRSILLKGIIHRHLLPIYILALRAWPQVVCPDVLNSPLHLAVEMLRKAGLKVDPESEVASQHFLQREVIVPSQKPTGGRFIDSGSTVQLKVECPNVINQALHKAVERFHMRGLKVENELEIASKNWLQWDVRVKFQNPAAGKNIKFDSTVTLKVICPNVINKQLPMAEDTLHRAGLSRGNVTYGTGRRWQIRQTKVTKQQPSWRSQVAIGSSVELWVSVKPPPPPPPPPRPVRQWFRRRRRR